MALRFRTFVYLWLAIITVGCGTLQNQLSPTVIMSRNPLGSSFPTAGVSITPQVTQTRPSSNTPSPSPSPTIDPGQTQLTETDEQAIPICSGKGQIVSQPTGFGITGTLVYQMNIYTGLFTLGGTPLHSGQISLADAKISVYGFSPDGQWLAYAVRESSSDEEIVFATPTIILLSFTKERMEQKIDVGLLEEELKDRCPSCRGFQFFDSAGEWINNGLLYIHLGARPPKEEGSMFSSLPQIFDPFTGDWQNQWFEDLPDLYEIYPTRVGIDHIKLSPDLSRVLYPAQSGGIILRDVIQGTEILFDREFATPAGESIKWSSNSAFVAVVNMLYVGPKGRRLLLISRDGDFKEIVNDIYPLPEMEPVSLSWSSDGRYLAFVDGHNNVNLYLYDTQSDEYVYRCPLPGIINGYPSLIWSPDSEWIAFSYLPEGPMQLLSVQTGEVTELIENANPVGWSDDFPVDWP